MPPAAKVFVTPSVRAEPVRTLPKATVVSAKVAAA